MNKTIYEIDYIRINLERLIDNHLGIEIDIALFRDKIHYKSSSTHMIEIPFIKCTDYFFSEDFDNYTYNKCDIDTLLMIGLIKKMSPKTKSIIDKAVLMNSITANM